MAASATPDLFTLLVQAVSTADALIQSGGLTADQRRRVELLRNGLEPYRSIAFALRDLTPTSGSPAAG